MPAAATALADENNPAAPRISVLLLTYNQESTAREAALACLALEGGPYEIIFSDDASSDGTCAVLREVAAAYRGPHSVRVRCNAVNAGIGEHYNQLVAESSGELLVTAAGDDLSVRQRVRRLAEAWEAGGRRADLIASHVIDFDAEGRLHEVMRVDDLSAYRGVEDWAAKRPYIIGAGHAFTRRMMQRFGPMHCEIAYEDQIMLFRAIIGGGAITVDEPLVHYRRGGTSRKPVFESAEHMIRWRRRQDARERAEARQLIADADLCGCGEVVRGLLLLPMLRAGYLTDLADSRTNRERWELFRAARNLPLGWRFRKMLHRVFPHTTFVVKRALSVFHRLRETSQQQEAHPHPDP